MTAGANAIPPGGPGLKVIHVATRCATVDDFVVRLAPFCGDDGIVIPLADGLGKGTVSRFVFSLAGGAPVLGGRGQIVDVSESSGARTGRLRLLDLDDESHVVHARMLKLAIAKPAAPARLPAPGGRMPPPPPSAALRASRPEAGSLLAAVAAVTFMQDEHTPATAPAAGVPAAEQPRVRTDSSVPTPTTLDMVTLADEAAGGRAPAPPSTFDENAPVLAPPQTQPARVTGKVPGLTGKTARHAGVARPAGWAALLARLIELRETLLLRVPEAQREVVRRFSPLLALGVPLLLILLVGAATSDSGDEVAVAPKTSAEAPAPAPAPKPAVVAATVSEPVKMPSCRATVHSQPDGADVLWGRQSLGQTPLDNVEVPCGRSLVAISHARYERIVRNVVVHLDEVEGINATLARPEASLLVTSVPPGATVFLGEQDLGPTPTRLDVKRFEGLSLRVEKDGYEAWSRDLFVGDERQTVNVRLRRPKAKAKRRR